MSESILDEAITYCNQTLDELPESAEVAPLRGRLAMLERAIWSTSHVPTSVDQIVRLAKLLLDLRDEISGLAAQRMPTLREAV
jgi:hypothetical protein